MNQQINDNTDNNKYGGLTGPNAQYIKIFAQDNHEFILKKDHAILSGTIKAMITGPGEYKEGELNVIKFTENPLQSRALRDVCRYLTYKAVYQNSNREIPSFPLEPENALDDLMTSNFLDC